MVDTKLLKISVFDEIIKKDMYAKQTTETKENQISNCPLCAIGHDANKTKIWKLGEMESDYVQAWSKSGTTNLVNCQMLCKTHNWAKGNK